MINTDKLPKLSTDPKRKVQLKKIDASKKNSLEKMYWHSDEFTIMTCTRCGHEDEQMGNKEETIFGFYDDGWRATERHLYCPDCAIKFLK